MKKKNKDSRIYEKQRTSGAQDSSQSGSHEIESARGTVYLFAVWQFRGSFTELKAAPYSCNNGFFCSPSINHVNNWIIGQVGGQSRWFSYSRFRAPTVRKVLVDFAVFDWWRYCKVLCDVKFRQIVGYSRKLRHIEPSHIALSVKLSNSVLRVLKIVTSEFTSFC